MWNPDGRLPQIKYRPIFSPRTSYNQIKVSDEDLLADMTLNFDRFTINLLKKQFEARNGQITLVQFISIVNQHLKSWQSQLNNREVRLVRCLTILFKEIDINGNGLLDWEQFTNYIIEKATVLKNLKTKSDEAKSYSLVDTKYKKTDTLISKCVYVEDINKVAIFQQGSNVIKFMSPENGQFSSKNLTINMKQLVVNISSVKKQKNGKLQIRKKDLVLTTDIRILDMIYLSDEKYKVLMTSTSDGMIRGWSYNNGSWGIASQPDNQEEIIQHHFNEEIYCLSWDSINQILYCGEHSGKVCMWNLKTDTEKYLESSENEEHDMLVTQIMPMPKLQFIATAGMDGKIILWNTINYKVKSVYKEHTRGILTLAFNQSLILLFSAGFDHQICIWNPYISTLIHKIQIHNSPIMCMRITQSNNQLISVDEEGMVKISDTRKFNAVTGFSVVPHDESVRFNPSSLCVIKKPLKIVIVGNGVNIFEYDKHYNPNTTDDVPTMCCKFIQQHLLFLTPAGNKVKVWNALNGEVSKIFLNICPSDITSFCLDTLKKRMVIGTQKGQNNIYNVLNGAKFKELPKHNGEVTHIITHKLEDMQLFFTAGIDGLIYIYKEMQDFYEAPRTISIKNSTITRMIFSPKTNQLIVGTSSGWIGFYDRETAKLIGSYSDEEDITGLQLTSFDAVIVTNVRGKVTFVLLPPLLQRYEEGFSFRHFEHDFSTLERSNKSSQISMCAFDKEQFILYIIDQKSQLISYKIHVNEELIRVKQTSQKHLQSLHVQLLWIVKAHSQIIKSIQFLPTQKLIITSAYDKKVKIFSAKNGKFIDSLQQNYQKFDPLPVAYQRLSTGQIVSANMQPLFKRRPSIRTSTRYKINLTQTDPFLEYETIQHVLQNPRSNPDWKLFLEAHKHYLTQNVEYNKIIQQVNKFSCREIAHLNQSKVEMFQQLPLATRKRALDKIIQERKSTMKKIANNLSNQSILTRTSMKQLDLQKPQFQKSTIRFNKQERKIFDTYRKQNTKRSVVNKSEQRQNHLRLFQRLSRSKNSETIKDDSMLKSEEERKAVKRLNLALAEVRSLGNTERSFYKSHREKMLPRLM